MTPSVSSANRDLLTLTALALLVRLVVAAFVPERPRTDSACYFAPAREIVEGNGLTVPLLRGFLETAGYASGPSATADSQPRALDATDFLRGGGADGRVRHPMVGGAQVPMVLISNRPPGHYLRNGHNAMDPRTRLARHESVVRIARPR